MGKRHNIIVVANPKGGVSKTTSTGHLAMALAKKAKVCVVDFDRQKDLSKMFYRGESDAFFEKANIFTLLKYQTTLKETVKNKYGVDVIVAAPSLRDFQFIASKDIEITLRLKEILSELDSEIILIDTPGSGSYETITALMAADTVIIPVIPELWSIDTLRDFFKTINETISQGATIEKIYLLPTRWGTSKESEQVHTQLYRTPEFLKKLKEREPKSFEFVPLPGILTSIPFSKTIRDRTEAGEPLAENTNGKAAFSALADKIISELGLFSKV
ncbi:ParA family protein [Leptospira weilii]|uniref:CobQ/CobB/MinD/ParA nucleotide binding domain protein n=1 Tax=Leptospira weilii str. UI 13098 TaxID=1088542 RepID=M6QLY1_9LEPT|nr:ParA family protein [Leptospira weilii]EMN89897.1 CobQ/CobB/MinD/ParA nucleotide binding domain protein [Leptospira weilii str. UI 13098]OMI16181.1 chromosome partitioning protein ParA [Leptospira weilii serovar Heyan]UPY81181.1 ParA family protein [Leptospira weilii]